MRAIFSILLSLITVFIIGMSYLDTWVTADALEERLNIIVKTNSTSDREELTKFLSQQSWRKVVIFGVPLVVLNFVWWKIERCEAKRGSKNQWS